MAETPAELGGSERAFVARAREEVRRRIRSAGGWLPFDEYMEVCLHHPEVGYYGAWVREIGAGGDFVTAPELGGLFNEVVAAKLAEVAHRCGGGFLELGAGTGRFARRMAELSLRRGAALSPFLILESSPPLRALQAETLGDLAAEAGVEWVGGLPDGFRGVAFANEVIDALPCSVYRRTGGGWHERGVSLRGGDLVWSDRPAGPGRLPARLEGIPAGEGYLAEANLRGEALVRSVLERFSKGTLVVVDYGFGRGELYHPQRGCGTLMCHRRHMAFADPLRWPGICDITSHVDFTGLAEAAREVGAEVLGFCDLAGFLLEGGGLDRLVADIDTSRGPDPRAAELKRLLMPQEMGQLFKVAAFGVGGGVAPPMGGRPRPL